MLQTLWSGTLTVALPTIGKQIGLTGADLQWPLTMYSLTQGAFLLIAGALADSLGRRLFFFIGIVWLFACALALAFVRDSTAFIALNALLGVGCAILFPPATGLLSGIKDPQLRNYSYAALGAGQPAGFIVGLFAGGLLADRWQIVAYMFAGGAFLFFVTAVLSLPADEVAPHSNPSKLKVLLRFDWLGALLSTSGLVLLTFALANAGSSSAGWRTPYVPAMLPPSALALASFGVWEHRLEKRFMTGQSKIAPLLPHSIWKTPTLRPLLLVIFGLWAAFNCLSFYATLWIQEVQLLNPLQAALRFLPMIIAGVFFNVIAGLAMSRVHGLWLVAIGGLGCASSCLILAVIHRDTSYWAGLFICFILTVMTDLVFPPAQLYACTVVGPSRAAVAGGLFSTTTRLATSLGLALTATISSSVTSSYSRKHPSLSVSSPDALVPGYQAAMWFCFASSIAGILVGLVWLRGIGIVGCKVTPRPAQEAKRRSSGTEERKSQTESKIELMTLEAQPHMFPDTQTPSAGPSGTQTPAAGQGRDSIELEEIVKVAKPVIA